MEILFKTYQPDTILRAYIKKYWILKGGKSKYFEIIPPTGCIRIVFNRGAKTYLNQNINSNILKQLHGKEEKFQAFHTKGKGMGHCTIIGPSLDYYVLSSEGAMDCIVIDFTYLGIRRFFDLPAKNFKNKIYTPSDLNDYDLIKIQDKLLNNGIVIVKELDQFFIQRLSIVNYKNELEKYTIKALENDNLEINKVKELVDFTYLQPRQTQRYFSDYIGITPREFIIMLKIRKAVKMLREHQDLTIEEIASECGFCDKSYFNAVFTRFCGHKPSIAREEIQTMSAEGLIINEEKGIISFCIWL